MRRGTDSAVNFMPTATGRHLLLWQADGSNFDLPSVNPHGHELRFATTPWNTIAARMESTSTAEVDINNDNEKNLHYAFVPEGSATAVATWRAQPVTPATANELASKVDNGTAVTWQATKRVTYELQDLADVVPTHWQHANWQPTGSPPVQRRAAGVAGHLGERRGGGQRRPAAVLHGVAGQRCSPTSPTAARASCPRPGSTAPTPARRTPTRSPAPTTSAATRDSASTAPAAPAAPRAVTRPPTTPTGASTTSSSTPDVDDADRREIGTWLTGAWYTPANGGFDGRWTQLFADRP